MEVLILLDAGEPLRWQRDAVSHLIATGTARVLVSAGQTEDSTRHSSLAWFAKGVPALDFVPVPQDWRHASTGRIPDLVFDLRHKAREAASSTELKGAPCMRFESTARSLGYERVPFVEDVAGRRKTTEVLLILERDGRQQVLRRGRWRTAGERFKSFVQRVLDDIVQWPAAALPQSIGGVGSPAALAILGAMPARRRTMIDSIRFVRGIAASLIARTFRDLFRHEHWTIGVAAAPIHEFLSPGKVPPIEWRDDRRRNVYLADPMGVAAGSGCRVLAERFRYREGKGDIVILDFDPERGWSDERLAFGAPEHLSYPFVVDDPGGRYAIPECCESGQIALYELSADLQTWRKHTVLVDDFPGVDSTAFRWDGRWWLFATSKETGPDSHLYAWYADELAGPWLPHSHNPIKIDVGGARPGGTPFLHEGALYRPAQDCSETYGGSIVLHRILRLDPDGFEEELVARVSPDPNSVWNVGLHTLSSAGETLTCVDAKREVFSATAAMLNVRGVLRKLWQRL